MLESYLKCSKNSARAFEDYRQRFPARNFPNRRYFLVLYRKFRSNEDVFKKTRRRKQFIISENIEITVLAYFEAHKENSTRDLAREYSVSLVAIWRVLKKHKFIPYKYRRVQTLLPGDQERRLTFCFWFRDIHEENNNILRNIIWSDEANFSNRGILIPKMFIIGRKKIYSLLIRVTPNTGLA